MKFKLNKKIIFLIAIVALATLLFYFFTNNTRDDNIVKTDDEGGIINYNPPTDEEKNAGDNQKEKLDNQQQSNNNGTDKKNVTVIITDAGQYDDTIEVRSFIPDHYEDGTCTITFWKGDQSFSKDTPAYKDVSTTICTNPVFKKSDFPSTGTWSVTVAYESKNAKGKSETQTIEVR